jgi:hypothetical protein
VVITFHSAAKYWRMMVTALTKIAGSGSESGSISQRHGSADPEPDPHQNVMDPQHCCARNINRTRRGKKTVVVVMTFHSAARYWRMMVTAFSLLPSMLSSRMRKGSPRILRSSEPTGS